MECNALHSIWLWIVPRRVAIEGKCLFYSIHQQSIAQTTAHSHIASVVKEHLGVHLLRQQLSGNQVKCYHFPVACTGQVF